MGRRDAWVPTGRWLSHQAAIWLPLAGEAGGSVGRACGWLGAETRGSLCVWDDSGPMITACAYLGSVNKREREAEEVKKGKIVAGQRGVVGWEGRVPLPPLPSWQVLPGLGPSGEVMAVDTSVVFPCLQ